MSNTHWKKLINPEYLGSYSLDDGKGGYLEITPTILVVKVETVTGADGKKEDCMVMRFKEAKIGTVDMKPMIVNVTNAKTLEKLFHTPYIEQWAGRRITIGSEPVKAFGDTLDALRIRKTLPREQGAPKCLDCGSEITATEKMNAAQVVAFGQKRFGKALCGACLRKLMEAGQSEPAPPAQTDTVGRGISGHGIAGHGDGISEPVTDYTERDDAIESETELSEFERMMKEGR
jgi:ribosomal protein L34E